MRVIRREWSGASGRSPTLIREPDLQRLPAKPAFGKNNGKWEVLSSHWVDGPSRPADRERSTDYGAPDQWNYITYFGHFRCTSKFPDRSLHLAGFVQRPRNFCSFPVHSRHIWKLLVLCSKKSISCAQVWSSAGSRWWDGEMVRWWDGEMVRWCDGVMVRWWDGEMVSISRMLGHWWQGIRRDQGLPTLIAE